jgi:hypothetical protein
MRELLTLRHIPKQCGRDNTKHSWVDQLLSHILRLEWIWLQGHCFYMKTEDQKTKRLLQSRFNSIIFLLRLAGIPLKMKKISITYTIYMITATFCTCTTFLGMFVDVCKHRDDLGHVMKNIRVLIAMVNNWWIYAYARYVRTCVGTLLASQLFLG